MKASETGTSRAQSRADFLKSGAALAGGGAALAPRRAMAQAETVRVIFFPGASNLPLWCGLAKGFFAAQNLDLALTPTPGSVYMFQHLSAGDFDIALTAIDNAIAYDEGQGEAPLPNPADFIAFMGCDNGFLRLYARPGITSYQALRGKTLAVDALTTGYAFVLRRMLEAGGLGEGDYTLAAAGGTLQRYQKITAGDDYAATLLTPPFDLQARAQGLQRLGNAIDVLGRYQALCAVARRGWIAQNDATLLRFTRAYLQSLAWMYRPENRAEATLILSERGNLAPQVAQEVYGVVVDEKTGIFPTARIDEAGVATVLRLRERYGMPHKTLRDVTRYVDQRVLARAAQT
ncbi:MAG: ABC transporter substrate-binding protein [Candidatus Eremiobacteraeota bacterium]|nr:ABC transporter substrate-binding protein [Candidatus Eremiobacteraeota bacterium]MBV8354080.1 ABC transporter substrate-binding protein [Candidatus Eremiobacteraeota bacterium]